jgi:AcrR family transcriptional regulator
MLCSLLAQLILIFRIQESVGMMPKSSKPKKPSGQYHHGDLKYALVAAAKDLLKKNGPEGLTLRQTARAVGVSHTAPYRHFADKNELLAEVATGGFYTLKQVLKRVIEDSDGDRLFEMGMAYVLFAVEQPHLYRLMFGPAFRDKAPHPQLEQAAEDAFAELVELIQLGQDNQYFRAGDTREFGTILWALVHGLANLVIDGQVAPEDPSQLGGALASFVRCALLPLHE